MARLSLKTVTRRIKQLRARRTVIVEELSKMSRDWSRFTAADWQPLERELNEINAELLS
jgi:hypothetical protein